MPGTKYLEKVILTEKESDKEFHVTGRPSSVEDWNPKPSVNS